MKFVLLTNLYERHHYSVVHVMLLECVLQVKMLHLERGDATTGHNIVLFRRSTRSYINISLLLPNYSYFPHHYGKISTT